jgi:hypothetical protein
LVVAKPWSLDARLRDLEVDGLRSCLVLGAWQLVGHHHLQHVVSRRHLRSQLQGANGTGVDAGLEAHTPRSDEKSRRR